MFNDLVESVTAGKATNKRWGFALSLVCQSACLLTLILIPLIFTQALPKAMLGTFLVAPAARAPARFVPSPSELPARDASRIIHAGIINEPTRFPERAAVITEPPVPPEASDKFGVPGGVGSDLLDFIADDAKRQSPAPPAGPQPTAPEQVQPQRIALRGVIEEAKLISRLQPIYPTLAIQTHIQGVVVLHAIVDKDGHVGELRVISGHPVLAQAAMQAVNQWRYRPTLLNSQPVEVETTITVSFVLGG